MCIVYVCVLSMFANTGFLSFCRYAESADGTRTPSKHMKAWCPLSETELDDFLALRLLMGIDTKPHIREYWSTDQLRRTPIFPNTMSRDRFDQLSQALHLEDNDGVRQDGDRIWKIRTIVDLLNDRCNTVYMPTQVITVDESLWKFRGRLGFIQYNPCKRARYGVKVYKLSTSEGKGAGYTSAFKIYTGQDKTSKQTNVSKKVVVDLMEMAGLFDKGYTLNTDNWYSSPELFHYLQARKTNAVGTANMRRKWMPKESDMNLGKAKGSMARRSTATGMLCVQWVDKKVVTVLSTCHTSQMTTVRNRRDQEMVKPRAVVDYNSGKKGVDLSDQLAKSYPMSRKSSKWYKKIFFFLLDLVVVNAHAVHKILGGSLSQLDFRMELVRGLLATGGARPPHRSAQLRLAAPPSQARLTLPVTQEELDRQTGNHFPSRIEGGKYRRCHLCYKDDKTRKNTPTECLTCSVSLCTYGCFARYHS